MSQCWGRRDQEASCSDPAASRELATQREDVRRVRSLLIGHPTVGTSQEAWPWLRGFFLGILETYRDVGTQCAKGNNILARGGLSCPESDLRLPGHQIGGSWLAHSRPLLYPHLWSLHPPPTPTVRTPIPSQLICHVLVVVHGLSTPRLWSFESQGPPHDEEAVGSLDVFGGAKGWREAAENRSRCLDHPCQPPPIFSA